MAGGWNLRSGGQLPVPGGDVLCDCSYGGEDPFDLARLSEGQRPTEGSASLLPGLCPLRSWLQNRAEALRLLLPTDKRSSTDLKRGSQFCPLGHPILWSSELSLKP